MLHLFYGKQVVVIADSVDKPLLQALVNPNFAQSDITYCLSLVQTMIASVMKRNEDIKKTLMAGNYAIHVSDIAYHHFGVIPGGHTKFFGLSQREFDVLCAAYCVDQPFREMALKRFNGLRHAHI
jgi:hypothetical protein